MCMYVAHWNIFMVNKRDLQKKEERKKKVSYIQPKHFCGFSHKSNFLPSLSHHLSP